MRRGAVSCEPCLFHPDCDRWSRILTESARCAPEGPASRSRTSGAACLRRAGYRQWGIAPRPETEFMADIVAPRVGMKTPHMRAAMRLHEKTMRSARFRRLDLSFCTQARSDASAFSMPMNVFQRACASFDPSLQRRCKGTLFAMVSARLSVRPLFAVLKAVDVASLEACRGRKLRRSAISAEARRGGSFPPPSSAHFAVFASLLRG